MEYQLSKKKDRAAFMQALCDTFERVCPDGSVTMTSGLVDDQPTCSFTYKGMCASVWVQNVRNNIPLISWYSPSIEHKFGFKRLCGDPWGTHPHKATTHVTSFTSLLERFSNGFQAWDFTND